MFLRSNLHDGFSHSLFRQQFLIRFGEDVRYEHPGGHHQVESYAAELHNLQTREVESTYVLGLRLRPDSEATPDTVRAVSEVGFNSQCEAFVLGKCAWHPGCPRADARFTHTAGTLLLTLPCWQGVRVCALVTQVRLRCGKQRSRNAWPDIGAAAMQYLDQMDFVGLTEVRSTTLVLVLAARIYLAHDASAATLARTWPAAHSLKWLGC